MIRKVVEKGDLHQVSDLKKDLQYWLSKTQKERVQAVEFLRRQVHGSAYGLQRIIRVVKREQG